MRDASDSISDVVLRLMDIPMVFESIGKVVSCDDGSFATHSDGRVSRCEAENEKSTFDSHFLFVFIEHVSRRENRICNCAQTGCSCGPNVKFLHSGFGRGRTVFQRRNTRFWS